MSAEPGPVGSLEGRVALTVSQLNRAVAQALARQFFVTRVQGEIANFTRAASGHWYFTLKDATAQVRGVMFRGRNALVDFAPREGDAVEVSAQVTLYEARGEYQLAVESMTRAGAGRLYEEFVRRRDRLQAEGLFDASRKRVLPAYPRALGIVTSLQAAALRDVLATLAARAPHVGVVVYPVPVQGAEAGLRMAQMLATVARRREVDTILLVRGGGSIEDLWAFNDETLARAIRACAIPVVSGVGHESDFTLADFAADVRAPTPTAAAQLAAPDRAALLDFLASHHSRLARHTGRQLDAARQRVDLALRALAQTDGPLHGLQLRLQQLEARTAATVRRQTVRAAAQLAALGQRLALQQGICALPQARVAHLHAALDAARRLGFERRGARLDALHGALQYLDPHAVLLRGYAIALDARGAVVRSARQLHAGDRLRLQLGEGVAQTEVRKVEIP